MGFGSLRRMFPALLVAATLALPAVAPANPLTAPGDAACREAARVAGEMESAYRKILDLCTGDAAFTAAFIESQRSWTVFRDAHLASLYPDRKGGGGGSAPPHCRCQEQAVLTAQRLAMLLRWLDVQLEGEECSGTTLY